MRPRRSLMTGCAAIFLPLVTILIVVWPNLKGTYGTGAETAFDLSDPPVR